MRKIRVLIIDDAVVVRRIVSDVLGADPAVEVAGTAANGKIGLAKIPQVNPDLVTLDVEMPEMDGLATLRELRKAYPRLPVIMFSTLTARGAESTLDALAAGANDYVTKPANVGSVAVAMTRIRDELIPKIKALVAKTLPELAPPVAPVVAEARAAIAPPKAPRIAVAALVEALVIGVSTGGPNALAELIPMLPANLPVPVLIVQHMPPVFTRMLAERLDQKSALTVREGAEGELVQRGNVYIAPGNAHMTLLRSAGQHRIHLTADPPENSCRPAVDVLFRSAASQFGAGTLAVVLTGMGQDGLRGAQAVHDAGGHVLVQDEASSVVWGMPGFVARAGVADRVAPLATIAQEIIRRTAAQRPIMAA